MPRDRCPSPDPSSEQVTCSAVVATTSTLFLTALFRLWHLAFNPASWSDTTLALAFIAVCILIWRALALRLVTKPFEPRGPGPWATA
jgi:hypothetical protein